MSALIMVLILSAIFFAIYRSARGQKSTKLKKIGWLELLIVYLCVLTPIGLISGFGQITPLFEKIPTLKSFQTFDTLTRWILIFSSFYVSICLLKALNGAVRKAKIVLVALLIFNVLVVKGIYNIVIYTSLAKADLFISAKVVVDALTKDFVESLVTASILVSWYIYLNRSRRVKGIYSAPSAAQIILPEETEMMKSVSTPVAKKDSTII